MSAKVVVVGSVNVDLAVRVPHLPRPGETVSGGGLEQGTGGKGANQAVAAARLGARTALIARVGADEFGRRARQALSEAGVGVAAVTTVAAATGTALIVIGPDGENTIAVSPGANAELDPEGVRPQLERELDGAGALLLQLEVPVATCREAARLARAAGVPVVLNAAPLPEMVGAELRELIAAVDVLVVNEVEAADLLGVAQGQGVLELPERIRGLGPGEVVVTLGPRGAAHTGPDGAGVRVPAFAVEAVDAVGAGDAFCAALAVALAEGTTDLGTAVRRASAVGALATTGRGAQGALPTRAEVDAFLAGRTGGPS